MCKQDSADAEPRHTEGRLDCTILSKGLERPQILVFVEVLEPIPCGYRGMTVCHYIYTGFLLYNSKMSFSLRFS